MNDFQHTVGKMVEDAVNSNDGFVLNQAISALGGGVAIIACLCETPEMIEPFLDSFCTSLRKDAVSRYDDLADMREACGTMSLTAPSESEVQTPNVTH